MRKIKFQEYFKLCNWWIWLQKNFDGYHVEQFVSSEEIKFWKVLRRCLWNIAASENNISLQNEKNSCCSSKRKLLTENDDFSYFQLFSTSPTPPPQMWDKLHCKKNMNRLPGGRFFCPVAVFFAQWPILFWLRCHILPSGRFFWLRCHFLSRCHSTAAALSGKFVEESNLFKNLPSPSKISFRVLTTSLVLNIFDIPSTIFPFG